MQEALHNHRLQKVYPLPGKAHLTIANLIRTLLLDVNVPARFWAKAAMYAFYKRNQCPSKPKGHGTRHSPLKWLNASLLDCDLTTINSCPANTFLTRVWKISWPVSPEETAQTIISMPADLVPSDKNRKQHAIVVVRGDLNFLNIDPFP